MGDVNGKEEFEVGFEEMVAKLFKKQGMHPQYEALMHAAIGISGEVGEILEAWSAETPDKENLLEEYGDLEFYMEALCQAAGITEDTLGTMCELLLQKEGEHLYTLMEFVVTAGNILDSAKRCWIYGKDLEALRAKLVTDMAHLTLCADQMYKAGGTKYEDIRHQNMVKLIGAKGRYRNQMYSDEAANARADKQEEGKGEGA